MKTLSRYIIIIFSELLLMTAYCFGHNQSNMIDSIWLNHHNLSKRKIQNLHKQLQKLLLPRGVTAYNKYLDIDSLHYAARYQSRNYLNKIALDNKRLRCVKEYMVLGDNYIDSINTRPYNIYLTNKSINETNIDSLKYMLALDCYIKAISQKDISESDKISAVHKIAEIYKKQGKFYDAEILYLDTLDSPICTDSLRYITLDSIIDCMLREHFIFDVDYNIVSKVLPLLQEQILIAERYDGFDVNELYRNYRDISYILNMMGDTDDAYMYSLEAAEISTAAKSDYWGSIPEYIDFRISPYKCIGDYMLHRGKYDLALKYYMYGVVVKSTDIITVSPVDMFNNAVWKPDNVKSSAGFPYFAQKVAHCYYKLGNQKECDTYLVESFLFSLDYILESEITRVLKNYDFNNKISDYELIIRNICNHSDASWSYNSALLLKGYTLNFDNACDLAITHKNIGVNYYDQEYNSDLIEYPYWYNTKEYIEKKLLVSNIFHNIYAVTCYNLMEYVHQTECIAIEYVYAPSYEHGEDMYYAILISPQNPAPIKIKLCTVKELEKHYIEGEKTYNTENSAILYNLIWSKLEPYINEGDNVYFAPDGLLYQMNIEVLQDADGRRANEKWNLHRVSSTRELCIEKSKVDINSVVLYGGLKYTMDDDELLAASRTYSREDIQSATRGFVADSTMRKGWDYLPETKTEVESIAQMCESHDVRAEIFSETAGNEESFKALSDKKTPIIHLATHGFFYKNEEVTKEPFFNTFNFDEMPQKPDNSLKRSGLILAGGQKAWLGEAIPDSVEDGILLAEEIATMDLTGTDLVVLSACETGLGEITSEGVFGLQRAFKKAGVQTIIMSLWSINDLATSLFMRVFYQEWLSGKTKHEAFAIAQNTVRESYEGNDWAAFIMLD